ncbi:MAG: hypothetical protein AAF938_15790 [Myxococcota bacterium]
MRNLLSLAIFLAACSTPSAEGPEPSASSGSEQAPNEVGAQVDGSEPAGGEVQAQADAPAVAPPEGCPALEGPVLYQLSSSTGDGALEVVRELRENGAWRSEGRAGCLSGDELEGVFAELEAVPLEPSEEQPACQAVPDGATREELGGTIIQGTSPCGSFVGFDPTTRAFIERIVGLMQ